MDNFTKNLLLFLLQQESAQARSFAFEYFGNMQKAKDSIEVLENKLHVLTSAAYLQQTLHLILGSPTSLDAVQHIKENSTFTLEEAQNLTDDLTL